MKIYKNVFNTWAIFHIGFIILISSYSAYHKYCRFYKAKEEQLIKRVNNALLFNVPMLYYGKLTGTGTGYGFFAPNIKSAGIIMGDCDGKKIYPLFKNFETVMRFSVLSSKVTDYLITTNDAFALKDKTLQDKYYSLVFKSIAVKIYNQNHCTQDTFYVSYNILEFPTLAAYRNGDRNYRFQKIKEVRLIKQKQ